MINTFNSTTAPVLTGNLRIWQLQTFLKESRCFCPFCPPSLIQRLNIECSTESSTVVMRTKSNNVNVTVSYIIFFTRKNITGSSWEHFAFPQKVMIWFFFYKSLRCNTQSEGSQFNPPPLPFHITNICTFSDSFPLPSCALSLP